MSVLELLAELDAENRLPSAEEQGVLARWSGWGSLPEVFDDTADHAEPALRARELLAGRVRAAAARTTLNAHYTDAALVKAVWAALGEAGFDEAAGGRVLEPGCGSGTFIGFTPDHVRDVVGVELDPTTARVASLLYPAADIRAESFAETRLPEGRRDLVIGNVPFADVVPHDKTYNSERLSLHNYFIYKSLHLVRPGGVVAVLTSRWTMDAANPAAREAFASMADLVSALRLPNQTHHRAAGTDVITDLLVFRRRVEGENPLELMPSWRGLEPLPSFRAGPGVEDKEVNLNGLFVQQPARVLGRLTSRMGRFGPEVAVSPPLTTDGQSLAERAATDLQRQLTFDLTTYAGVRPLFTPRPVATRPTATPPALTPIARPGLSPQRLGEEEPLVLPDRVVRAEGHISMDGGWQHLRDGVPEPLKVPKSQANELRMLLGLRDTVVTLLEAEATTPLPGELATATALPTGPGLAGEEQMAALRERLNRQYDTYVKRYGPINRVTSRNTGRFDPKTGEPVLAHVRPRQGGFGDDPHSPPVFALEHYDSATGTARKADIFTERVVAPRAIRTHADSPADAASLCLETYGELRTSEIARLLGVDQRQAEDELEGFAFVDPDTVKRTEDGWSADWVPRAEFLSGNVRARLTRVGDVLEQLVDGAAAFGEESAQPMVLRLQAAEAALVEVLPEDLGPTEIVAQLGVPWVPAETVEQFLHEVLEDRTAQVEHPGGSVWSVRGNRHSVAATNTWGTARACAIDIVQACLEQRQIRVTDETPDGRRIPNETETFAAQEKAEELQERFATWLWEDPDRCQQLVRRYNDALNAIVLRSYDVDEDKHYPGMAQSLRLRPHQHAAVARMVAQPSVLLAHEVGAGKTLAAVTGVSELRRLGLVRKPSVVVPNHRLEQFSREWLQAYPQARILTCGTEDLVKDKRQLFVARAATGEWDAVILSRSAFEKIPVSKNTEEAYLDEQLTQLRMWLAASKDGRGLSVKRLEGTLARAEERLKALRDVERDPAITFEATGIDYLCVDEAHGYKNLRLASNIPGVAVDGSNRATDLDLKMSYLRGRHGRRVATFMTATPIANSVAEAYTMLRYLAPADLEAAGISDFDTWAATFGQVVTDLELPLRDGVPDEGPVREVQQRPGAAAAVAPGHRREDRRGPPPAHPRPGGRSTGDGGGAAEPGAGRLHGAARQAGRRRLLAGGRSERRQHAQDQRPRPRCRARPAAHRPPDRRPGGVLGPGALEGRRGRRTCCRHLPRPRRRRLRRRPGAGRPAAGFLRPGYADRGGLERLRGAQGPARLPRGPRGQGAVHARGQQRPREGAAVRAGPHRPRVGADRVDGEDGRGHERAEAGGGAAPCGLPVAAGRPGAARRPHHAAGQPERVRPGVPVCHRVELRHLPVADGGAEGEVHQPADARPTGCARDRGHRRLRALLRRGEGPGLG